MVIFYVPTCERLYVSLGPEDVVESSFRKNLKWFMDTCDKAEKYDQMMEAKKEAPNGV